MGATNQNVKKSIGYCKNVPAVTSSLPKCKKFHDLHHYCKINDTSKKINNTYFVLFQTLSISTASLLFMFNWPYKEMLKDIIKKVNSKFETHDPGTTHWPGATH